jgi:hypothetical protein
MAKTVKVQFGGAEREFRLAIGELRELQEKCQAGPATVLARLMAFQPQAAKMQRPRPNDYGLADLDPDFHADSNLYGLFRNIGGDWRLDDVRETIRLGLIGGGMSPMDAFVMVARYVDDRPLTENTGAAAAVLMHALIGEPDDKVGKTEAEKGETKPAKKTRAG